MDRLIPLVYRELRMLADHYLRAERIGHTLQPTALVNEVYLRLVKQDKPDWKNRAYFLGVAAQVMRRILVDYARARQTAKRAGVDPRIEIDVVESGAELRLDEILIVDEALDQLAQLDPQQTRIVELRYFAGLTVDETALAGHSPYTIGDQLPKAVQTICETDPERLSSFNRTYRGDIETIVSKALEKDKARRYSSAAELAADIERHLNDEPIVARRSSTAYHLQKFARRHSTLVSAVAAAFVMLIAGVIASTREAARAWRAEVEAPHPARGPTPRPWRRAS